MSDKTEQPRPSGQQEPEPLHTIRINGHCPTGREAKRILTTAAHPVDENDPATSPLHSAVRGFKLMR